MHNKEMDEVLRTIRSYSMFSPGDRVVAAVSGGPDSVLLLLALAKFKKKLGVEKITVCNLDHGLRGKESREDSAFVKKMAGELGFGFAHKKVDLKKNAPKGISTEEAAREARYDFFRKTLKKTRSNVLATGHTLDDQAETILMRIIKGASLRGMVGISPVRAEGDIRFVRPLIQLEKKEIIPYLDSCGIEYRVDATNIEPIYFRNVVRKDIIPFLEKYNPRLKKVLFTLAEHLREDFEFIHNAKSRVMREMVRSGRNAVEISLKDIVVQPRAIQKEILRDSLEKSGGLVKKLSFKHWKEIEDLIRNKKKGSSVDLPGSIRAARTDKVLRFSRI